MRRPQGCSTDYVPLGAVLFPARLGDIKEADKGNEGKSAGKIMIVWSCDSDAAGIKDITSRHK